MTMESWSWITKLLFSGKKHQAMVQEAEEAKRKGAEAAYKFREALQNGTAPSNGNGKLVP